MTTRKRMKGKAKFSGCSIRKGQIYDLVLTVQDCSLKVIVAKDRSTLFAFNYDKETDITKDFEVGS